MRPRYAVLLRISLDVTLEVDIIAFLDVIGIKR